MAAYINGIGSVSIQEPSFDVFSDTPVFPTHFNKVQHPSYKDLIAPAMIRRMASGVKMGIYAADQALKEAQTPEINAIVTGTGLGCIQDSEKFLDAIIENDEEFLTPTSFIQSTHNTVGAQIALHLGCKAYNFSYVNGANSFENALYDAILQIDSFQANNVLLGGVDEIAPYTYSMFEMIDRAKSENDTIAYKNPSSNGVPLAEGANFFVISNTKEDHTYAQVLDVKVYNQLPNTAPIVIERFLTKNNLTIKDIDLVFLGVNADQKQEAFFNPFTKIFQHTAQAYYQQISGSFDTASAYGFKVAAEALKKQQLPQVLQYNDIKPIHLKTILLINQFDDTDYSFVLIRSC